MNINELGGGPERISSGPQKVETVDSRNALRGRKADSSSTQETGSSQHARDPEVVRLVQRLNESPEVRRELVDLVQQRLASGEYSTRSAAERTAASILGK